MALTIIENHSDCGVNIRKIIERIIRHAPPDCLDGLEEIRILNKDPADISFAKYDRIQKRIEIYKTFCMQQNRLTISQIICKVNHILDC